MKVIPRPKPETRDYTAINYTYAGQTGSIHEVLRISGRELVKVGFPDRKIVYYLLEDLELLGEPRPIADAKGKAPAETSIIHLREEFTLDEDFS